MSEATNEELQAQISRLQTEHRDLDQVLQRLANDNSVDDLQIRRLKKRKLQLKDSIARLESEMLPNITA